MSLPKVFALILKIGTGRINLSVLTDNGDGTGGETERIDELYSGIANGYFCYEKDFYNCVRSVFKTARKKYKDLFNVKTLYVCVPEEFTSVVKRIATLEFSSKQVIGPQHLNALKEIAERDFFNNEKYTVKQLFVESFTVDDAVLGNKLTLDTTSEKYISMKTNIVLLKRQAMLTIEDAISRVSNFDLRVFTLSDAIIRSVRDSGFEEMDYLLVNISENSTSFSYVSKGRFSALRNMSLGLNVFTGPLIKKFRLKYEEAFSLLSQFNVFSYAGDKKIEISRGKNIFSCTVSDIFNCINVGPLKDFFHYIRIAYQEIRAFIPYELRVVFTGDGMAVPGLDKLLAEKLRIDSYTQFKTKANFRAVGVIAAERYVLNKSPEVYDE